MNGNHLILEGSYAGSNMNRIFYVLDLSTGILKRITGIHGISGTWSILSTPYE